MTDTNSLSNQADKLKLLLQKDDERRRRQAIIDISDRNKYSSVHIPNATDIAPLVDNQASVEQQLQEQVNFYQDALLKLKERSDEITNENARLYQRMRDSVVLDSNVANLDDDGVVSTDDENTSVDDRETKDNDLKRTFPTKPKERLLRTKNECRANKNVSKDENHVDDDVVYSIPTEFSGHDMLCEEITKMQYVYETKTKHLSNLLKDTRRQAEEYKEEIWKLKSDAKNVKTFGREGGVELYCSRCAVAETNLQPAAVTLEKKMIDRLTRERNELVESIKKQKDVITAGNHREMEAYHQVKKSCELVQQAQIEKQEALVQSKQLQRKLDEYIARCQKLQKNVEENQVDRKSKEDMEEVIINLNKKVDEYTNLTSVLQVQTEKMTREKVDLEKELEKMKLHIMTQKAETAAIVEDSRKEVMNAFKEKTLIEQESHQYQLDLKKREKQKQMEVDQLLLELQETKRRLQLNEQTLQQQQNEVFRLTKTTNSYSQQLQNEKYQRQIEKQAFEDEKKKLQYEREEREEEIVFMLQETDQRYSAAKQELTSLLDSQTDIVTKYQEEYKILHNNMLAEKKKYQDKLTDLVGRCEEMEKQMTEHDTNGQKQEVIIHNYHQQITHYETELDDYKEQIIILMNKQNMILRDRNLLSKEVELLRNQLNGVTAR